MVVSNRDKISKDVAKDAGKENTSNATLSSEAKELGRPPSVGERYGRPRGTESLLCKGTADEPPPEKRKSTTRRQSDREELHGGLQYPHTHTHQLHTALIYTEKRVFKGV